MDKSKYSWENGFQQRTELNANSTTIKRILEHQVRAEVIAEESDTLCDYSISVIKRLEASEGVMHTRIGKAKREIVESLSVIYLNDNVEQKRIEESNIRTQLMKQNPKDRNILSQYTRQQRIEFNARKNNLV